MSANKILIHNMTFNGIHVVPGVIDYDQRGIVAACKNDVVVTNNQPDTNYLDYLGELGYPIKYIRFINSHFNEKTWNSIFEDEEVYKELKKIVGKQNKNYVIDVYNPSHYDTHLAMRLGIDHCNNYIFSEKFGTKSGFHDLCEVVGLPHADRYINLHTVHEVVVSLQQIFSKGYRKAVIKVDDGISGYGNMVISKKEFSNTYKNKKLFCDKYLNSIRWNMVGSGVVEGWIEDVVSSFSVLIKVVGNRKSVVCLQDQLFVCEDKWAGCFYPSSILKNKEILSLLNQIINKSSSYISYLGFWGYYSFDVIQTRENKLYVVESNMRKIGSFYPRVLVKRMLRSHGWDLAKTHYIASGYSNLEIWKGKKFNDIYVLLKDILWPIQGKNKGVLLYNVGAIKDGGRFDYVVVSENSFKSDEMRREVNRRLNKGFITNCAKEKN
jgi:hypothetical protein